MTITPRLSLPYIIANQAQKEVTHGEGLNKLDILVQARILDRDLSTPPGSPNAGDSYLVAATATGNWIGQEGMLATYQDETWVFTSVFAGLSVWVHDERAIIIYDGTAWATVTTIDAPLALPSYTTSTLPIATSGGLIYVSDETGGAVTAFADGTHWRRTTDRAIVS